MKRRFWKDFKAWSRRALAPLLERAELIPPRSAPPPATPKAPSRDAVLKLIKQSGYPLEIDLFHALDRRGCDPTHSFVLRSDAVEGTRELDLIGRFRVEQQYQEGDRTPTAWLELLLMIEAKNWGEHRVFVGFVGNEFSRHEMLVRRTRIGGTPTFNLDGGAPPPFFLQLAEGFAALNDAPFCMQWGSTIGGEKVALEHDDRTFKGLQTAVASAVVLGRENGAFMRTVRDAMPRMQVLQPVLVIDTPKLFLFDVRTNALTETNRLIIETTVELLSGPSGRLVDVMTRKGFDEYLDACGRCMAALQPILTREIHSVAMAHAGQLLQARERTDRRP